MTPERWRHIQEVFHDALAHPAAERAAFLDDACAGDAALRTHVEALLAADAAPAAVLDASLDDLAAALPFPLPPEGQVGPYRLDGPLGRGGMGVVYRAYDARLDRPVALKFLPPHLSRDTRARQRFVAEARAASALDHPHICTIYDVGEAEDGRTYIAMAYYEGQTLKERLAEGPLPSEDAVAIATQVAEALAAAHARGIVHRDVKPGNLFLTEAGSVKLLDFGLAKTAGADLTRPGTTLGTVAYMSPEQARGEAAGAQSDLWALGVVLYEMLSGERPFRGERAPSILRAVLDDAPVPLPALRPDVPPALVRVVETALQKDPAERYPGAAEMAADLRGAPDLRRAPHAALRRPRWPGRWAVYTGAALLVGLLALWIGGRPGETAPVFESIAVLPLDDFSQDPEAAYFADGMTEALIANLAQIEALRVISRTSVMPYRETERSLPEIARALGVDAVIEGSVTRADGRARITVQLIDAATDEHLWAQSYERPLDDVLALQEDVARAIAAEVRVQLTPQEQTRLASARPVDPAAYEAYLRGRYQWNTRTPDGLRRAIERFREAIARDPAYAPAHAGLAAVYSLLPWYQGVAPTEAFPRAEAAARHALALDTTQADAYVPLALARWQYHGDRAGAEAAFRQALALNPSNATARQNYGQFLSLTGRFEEGLDQLERARTLDPLSPVIATDLASAYLFDRRYEDAVTRYRAVLATAPGFPVALVFLGMAYELLGRPDAAVTAAEQALEAGGRNPLWLAGAGRAYAAAGRTAEARAALDALEAMATERFVSPYAVALVHAALGEADAALALLEQALALHDPYLIYLPVDPRLDALRDDPRFAALERHASGAES